MSGGEMSSAGGNGPSGRAVRMWLGLLTALWVLVQIVAVVVCYVRLNECSEPQMVFLRLYATALGTAALAMLFVVGGVGLILNRPWGQRTILVGACLQIALTVATQILEVFTPMPNGEGILHGPLAAPLGILLWSVIPVGILILAAAVAKPPKPASS